MRQVAKIVVAVAEAPKDEAVLSSLGGDVQAIAAELARI